jgi:type III pantothenate kinase
MLLVFDVGNTHTVFGLFNGRQLVSSWRVESDRQRTVDEYALQLLSLLSNAGVDRKSIDSIVISCVVPALTRVFSKLSQKYFELSPSVVGPDIKLGIDLDVDDPKGVGADRIVNALAARELFGAPSIVVDLGTATTFDVVGEDGRYKGGAISPGLVISAQALFDRAAMLPDIELKTPDMVIGRNTRDSMLSGIVYGYVALVDGMVDRLSRELTKQPAVVATGGLSRVISDQSVRIQKLVPELTLEGLRIIADLNR